MIKSTAQRCSWVYGRRMILFSFKTDCAKPELETIGTRKIESGSLVKISQYLETSSELQDETDFNSGLFPYTNPSGLTALKKSSN